MNNMKKMKKNWTWQVDSSLGRASALDRASSRLVRASAFGPMGAP